MLLQRQEKNSDGKASPTLDNSNSSSSSPTISTTTTTKVERKVLPQRQENNSDEKDSPTSNKTTPNSADKSKRRQKNDVNLSAKLVTASKSASSDVTPEEAPLSTKIVGISSVDSHDSSGVAEENIIIDDIHIALLSKETSQLHRILSECRGVVAQIQTASTLWSRAVGLSLLDFWWDPISTYVCNIIKEQLVEEDLFTDSTTVDLAVIVVELLGYYTVSSPPSTKLMQLQSPASFPTDFLRLILRVEPGATTEAVKHMFSCFSSYRLDRFLSDHLDEAILRSLSDCNGLKQGRQDNKSVAVALTVMFEYECTLTATTRLDHSFSMERQSALTPILAISPLSRSSPKQVIEQQAYFKDSVFANLPAFPAVTRLGCPNHAMVSQQLRFVRSNLNRLQELVAALFQRCLKVHRESVVGWVARLTYLVHNQMHAVGRHRLLETKQSEPWHSGFVLNLATVLLMLMKPLFNESSRFLSTIHVGYVTMAAHAKTMKGGPNMADGRIIASQGGDSDHLEQPEEDHRKLPTDSKHNFPTEIFWLTSTAMELVDKISMIQEAFIHQMEDEFKIAKERYEAVGVHADGEGLEMELSHLRQCFHGFYYGWMSSPLCDPYFLSLSCSWAQFAASFVRLQMKRLDQDGDGDQDVESRLRCIPVWLLKAVCSVWKRAAFGYVHSMCVCMYECVCTAPSDPVKTNYVSLCGVLHTDRLSTKCPGKWCGKRRCFAWISCDVPR